MTGEQTETDKGDAKKKPGLIVRVLLGLGVLHVYNVINHRQTVLDLSESVKILAAWWRYIISIPFQWIHWDLSPLRRETLVLLLFFGSAANLAHYREHGYSIAGEFNFFSREARNRIRRPKPEATYNIWMTYMISGAVGLALLYISYGHWLLLGPVAALFIFGTTFFLGAKELPNWMIVPIMLIAIPTLVFLHWVESIASYHRQIIRSLKFLLLLLLADVAARFLLDPLLSSMPVAITYPPATP
jgi:hypothetical protein